MRRIVALFVICLSLSWLAACEKTPVATEPVPTGTPVRTGLPSATMIPTEASSSPEILQIGDARFTSRSIRVESAAVAAADLNQDGSPDLVAAGEPELTIFLGTGTGELVDTSRVPGGENPVDFAFADLDEDGNRDIVVANHDTDYVTILLGDGKGAFRPAPISPLRVDVSPHPHAVRAADLDADGHVDLIVDHREAEGLLILKGLGNGGFESPGRLVEAGGDPYRGMAIGDLNGDGKLDLVTPNPGEIGILLNNSSEEIVFADPYFVDGEAPFAVEVGDFNGDGLLDLIAASDEGSPLVELFFGDGNGKFEQAKDSPFYLAPGAKKIAVGDFNGDAFDDAVVSSYQFAQMLVLLGGQGSIRADTLPAGEHPWGLAAADFNGDGKDDLVVSDDESHSAIVYLSLDQ